MKGREEMRVKKGNIASVVDGVGGEMCGVERNRERRFESA